MRRIFTACAVLLLLAASAALTAQELQPIPPLKSRVTDLTGTLTAQQQSDIENKLAAFEARKGAQLAVLIVPTTRPEEIEQYSIRVVDEWKLGREKVDDGALLLIAKDDRRVRIEVGYGLEGVLTDATSRRIIDETITPLFRQGDFYGGINAGLDQMIRVIDGEPLPEPDRKWRGGGTEGLLAALPFLIVAVFVGSMILRQIFGRRIGALLTGGGTGFLTWLITLLPVVAIFAGLIAFFFALIGGNTRRGRTWTSAARHAGWGGFGTGGFGRGGGFGGGFGGFRGGGGGFGGGGASGRW